MLAIRVSCMCTDGEVQLYVRARQTDEDIRDFMDHVTREIGKWHRGRGCPAERLHYLKLPLPSEGAELGQP